MTERFLNCACGNPLPPTGKTGRCRSCIARARYADPAQRAAMSEAKKRALQDPEKRARVAAAASETLKKWHREQPKTPEKPRVRSLSDERKVHRGLLWKVPAARREEYIRLRTSGKMTAQEAYDLIVEDEVLKVRRRMGVAQEL